MKKLYSIISAALVSGQLLAGGILTNTNQSVHFVRMLSRNASIDIDAVYFNPAGLVRMEDGFYFSLNNQTIIQDKTINTTFPTLNSGDYNGKVLAPSFPTFMAAYKKDKLALSFGFGPNSGGASAEFNTGLPSFEVPFSLIPGTVTALGISTTDYSADVYFNGRSIYWGAQIGASYAITDIISVSAGMRMIMAKNVYEGHIKDIQINPTYAGNPSGAMMSAPAFFTSIAQPGYAALTSNIEVDATQSGNGFTPIFGVHLTPTDKLDIGIKYEMNTKLELTNETKIDGSGLFPDDAVKRSDIPAILALGISYKLTDDFRASISFNNYFDKQADRAGIEDSIDKNMWELMVGIEYDLSDKITVSGGFMRGVIGVNDGYQNDLSYANSANTFGFGGKYSLTEKLSVELGVLYSIYDDYEITYTDYAAYGIPSYTTTYDKKTLDLAIGLNYRF